MYTSTKPCGHSGTNVIAMKDDVATDEYPSDKCLQDVRESM